MAKFLLGLCENNSTYLNLFLFDKNLFADVRLLLINELISTKYSMKFISIDHVQQFFFQIRVRIIPIVLIIFCYTSFFFFFVVAGKFQFRTCK